MIEQTIHVLMIEDDKSVRRLVRENITSQSQPNLVFHEADSLHHGFETLREQSIDVLLLDLNLPESAGLETLGIVRRFYDDLPIVVITAEDSTQVALKALENGAQDYLIKGKFAADSLLRVIRYAVSRHHLMREVANQNQRLAEKNEQLEQQYETAHQFVDNVSHEFRTPLTVLREFTSLIREGLAGPVNEQQAKYLDIIGTRTDDLAFMVDDMLDTSALEAGLMTVWRKGNQVDEIVQHVRPMLDRRAAAKNIDLRFEIPEDLPEIFGDGEKIGRVVINLAVNAIKFTPEGGKVTVWADSLPSNGEVLIGVTDTGPGISEENVQAIFRRFKKIGGPVRSSTKGFGLGLNIAKQLVQLNLGEIEVESQVGHGSTFRFTVPVNDPAELCRRFLSRAAMLAGQGQSVSLVQISIDEDKADTSPLVEEFLHEFTQASDLVYSAGPCQWQLLTLCSEAERDELHNRLTSDWARLCRNCPFENLPSLTDRLVDSWPLSEETQSEIAATFLAACRPQTEQMPFPSPHAQLSGKPRVLVVDDDTEVALGLQMRLTAQGYEVTTENDGAHCVDIASESLPDAIVLDVRMPGQDGIATLQQLKQRQETQEIPVVMLSASLRDQQLALEQGAKFFVQKPYDINILTTALQSSMKSEPPGGTPQPTDGAWCTA